MLPVAARTRVPLTSVRAVSWAAVRRGEPSTFGVPLPRGLAVREHDIGLDGPDGALAVQVRALDRWSDQSIRWVLISCRVDAGTVGPRWHLVIDPHRPAVPSPSLEVTDTPGLVRVTCGGAVFEFASGGAFPLFSATRPGEPARSAVLRVGYRGRTLDAAIDGIVVHERGPVRAELELRGRIAGAGDPTVDVVGTVEFFAGLPTARIAVTLRNPRPAKHRGGQWGLGDPGSCLLDFAAIEVNLGAPITAVRSAVEPGEPLVECAVPLEIYQDSSGGDHWNGPVHRNREGRVPLRFQGYRVIAGQSSRSGPRASPIVQAEAGGALTTAVLGHYWQRCPSAIRVEGRAIDIGLLPRQYGDVHELQGGEQTTERLALAIGPDPVSDPPLAWVHEPLLLAPDPAWVCATGVLPFVATERESTPEYRTLAAVALDPRDGLAAKREIADEYGWRNFGDLYADHESAFQPPDRPFVSHYNNQYDALAAFAMHFLRSGDPRWWGLMDDLARHVRDIDIYHTTGDKSAYNGGLFWHTAHYLDAGLSTHRTYPPGSTVSGGPSAEHNYNLGLMLHYFLTGDRASRDAAVGLGRWVIEMDDGRLTPFRWLSSGPTGLASLTRDYHGPGRGAGHSILACLVAARLTGDRQFTAKAEELIARVIHPDDDIGAHHLLAAERRWSYTAFLQVLGTYLHDKAEQGELDRSYGYAQASLLHYARWMAEHERPYLERRDELEFPTETWVAQELRKADVFFWAALHAEGRERERFLERARTFFDYVHRTLRDMPERRFTRPTVLVLAHGLRVDWLHGHHAELPPPAMERPWRPAARRRFTPQRALAVRRAAGLVLGAAATLAAAAAWFLSG